MSRRFRRALLVLLTVLVAGALAVVVVLQSDWLRDRLRRLAISQAATYLTGQLSIGHLSGSLFHDVVLDDVTLTQDDGVVMHAARVSVKYDWRVLVHRHLVLDDLLVEQPSLRVAYGPAGWNVAHLLRKRDNTGAPLALLIDRMRLVNGDAEIVPPSGVSRHLDGVNAEARLVRTSDHFIAQLVNVSLHDDATGYDVRKLTGRLEDGIARVDVAFAADRAASRVDGQLKATTDERGRHADVTLDLAAVDLQAFFEDPKWQSDLSLHADAHADATGGVGCGDVRVQDRGRARESARLRRHRYRGDGGVGARPAQVQCVGVRLRRRRDRPRDLANQRHGWTAGRHLMARVPSGMSRCRSCLPRSKVPPLQSRLAGKYQVHQDVSGWNANVVMDASTAEGASIAAGTTGALDQRGSVTMYTADGDLDGLDLNRLARTARLAVSRGRAVPQPPHGPLQRRRTRRLCRARLFLEAIYFVRPRRWPKHELADTKLFDVTGTMTFTDPRLEVAARGRVEHLTTETMGVGEGTALDLNGTVDGTLVLDDVHAPFSLARAEREWPRESDTFNDRRPED